MWELETEGVMKQKLGLAVIVAALTYAVTSAGQEVRPVPGPGTGVVNVQGIVDIVNPVTVRQGSDWRVSLTGVPDVRVFSSAPLEFLSVRGHYQITWPGGQVENLTLLELGLRGWARVEGTKGRRRWINVAQAQAVEELNGGR